MTAERKEVWMKKYWTRMNNAVKDPSKSAKTKTNIPAEEQKTPPPETSIENKTQKEVSPRWA